MSPKAKRGKKVIEGKDAAPETNAPTQGKSTKPDKPTAKRGKKVIEEQNAASDAAAVAAKSAKAASKTQPKKAASQADPKAAASPPEKAVATPSPACGAEHQTPEKLTFEKVFGNSASAGTAGCARLPKKSMQTTLTKTWGMVKLEEDTEPAAMPPPQSTLAPAVAMPPPQSALAATAAVQLKQQTQPPHAEPVASPHTHTHE